MGKLQSPTTGVTSIQLCGVQGCCPSVQIDNATKRVTITDDDGGKVTLTKEQWQEAAAKVKL